MQTRHEHHQKRLKHAANIALILAVVIFFGVGILIGIKLAPEQIKEIVYKSTEKTAIMSIPAVNEGGQGILTELTAKLRKGDGQVLVNVNDVIAGYELQLSARNAVTAVQNVTGFKMDEYDAIISIKTNATLIEGNSASAAMAVTLLSLIKNVPLDPKVTMTGSVGLDGSVNSVGMVGEKAEAARKSGMLLFLAPVGQGVGITLIEDVACRESDYEFCKVEYKPKLVTAQQGITIKEVRNITEALQWFEFGKLQQNLAYFKEENVTKKEESLLLPDFERLGFTELSLRDYVLVNLEVAGPFMAFRKDCTALVVPLTEEQANSIGRGIDKKIVERPSIYDAMKSIFDLYGIGTLGVMIDRFDAGAFYSRLIIMQGKKVSSIDARPSDALALAVRYNRPVFMSKALMESRGQKVC